MQPPVQDWKDAADRLWKDFDHAAAARLAAEIARSGEPGLREAATQALPSLRAAATKHAGHQARAVAERRFNALRNALHALDAPRFGLRGAALSADERHRRMLGLPAGRRLYGPEIREAYKRAAKRAHPDAGGTQEAFLDLSAARDALLRGGES